MQEITESNLSELSQKELSKINGGGWTEVAVAGGIALAAASCPLAGAAAFYGGASAASAIGTTIGGIATTVGTATTVF
ncbi:hypothetical protein Halha_1933 [Halobacteroides halobius DSM 5150]|uniref:Class IIb bacteriocin, lactobin A/cerein 7B family n=1 Tax=Halobacteroides halobius (strain ATCC 35273 / DSM 5150 / MD-1) TaxID=748449 RepID=L0KBV9_HALHC|nr:hypothetical protein [Halobacteroides halobius]AGB41844.1 hypothetical protein Halha_1933 [Halobacteroides halobius DSM 5150]